MEFDIQSKRRRCIGKGILLRVCFRHFSSLAELFKPEGSGLKSGFWNPTDAGSSLLLDIGWTSLDAVRNRSRGVILRVKSCKIAMAHVNSMSGSLDLRGA